MGAIELTEAQRRVVETEQGRPVDVINPATREVFVLIAREQYERVRPLLENSVCPPAPETGVAVAQGILRSQQAFWRDLPELLKDKRNHSKWICYHGDERIGIAKTDVPLIRECLRRCIPDSEYDLLIIRPHELPPWEPEEVEPLGPHHLDDYPT